MVLWGESSKYRRTVISAGHETFFWTTLKTLGLIHTSNNFAEWQAVKQTFFAPYALVLSFLFRLLMLISALMAQNSSFT